MHAVEQQILVLMVFASAVLGTRVLMPVKLASLVLACAVLSHLVLDCQQGHSAMQLITLHALLRRVASVHLQ